MPRKKNVVKGLLDSAEAAFFAAVEIHNKPRISYRYPTATLLLLNAWELTLKAFVYKYINKKLIYENCEHTISFKKALTLVAENINTKENNKKFYAVYDNLLLLEKYRNLVTHYFEEVNDPIVFMLLARSTLNFNTFIEKNFKREIMAYENLIILPIGFSLPFEPVDFLIREHKREPMNSFAEDVINVIKALQIEGVEDTVVVGFNVFMESVKKCTNADIIAAIDQSAAQATAICKKVRFVNDENVPAVRVDETELIRSRYPHTYRDLCKNVKNKLPIIKMDRNFYNYLSLVKEIPSCYIERLLDPLNPRGTKKGFYSIEAEDKILELYNKAK